MRLSPRNPDGVVSPRIRVKMTEIIGNSSIYCALRSDICLPVKCFETAAQFSIRYQKANYFSPNIKFSFLWVVVGDDVTEESRKKKMYSSCSKRICVVRKEAEKASAIGRRRFSRKNDENMLKRKNEIFSVYCGKMCVKAWFAGSLPLSREFVCFVDFFRRFH